MRDLLGRTPEVVHGVELKSNERLSVKWLLHRLVSGSELEAVDSRLSVSNETRNTGIR